MHFIYFNIDLVTAHSPPGLHRHVTMLRISERQVPAPRQQVMTDAHNSGSRPSKVR